MEVREIAYDEIVDNKGQIIALLKSCLETVCHDDEILIKVSKQKYKSLVINKIKDNCIVYGAIEDNSIVGFLWCYKFEEICSDVLHVAYIAVQKEYSRMGIGRNMIELARKNAYGKGISTICLNVSSTNYDAIDFYNSIGFLETEKKMILKA